MTELLPCPFCGGIASIDEYPSLLFPYFVFCRGCGAESYRYKTKQEVIKAWNTRHERTCSFKWVEFPEGDEGWCCSNCGDVAFEFEDAPTYCPNCGAKVVSE